MFLLGHVGSAIFVWFIWESYTGKKKDFNKLLFAIGSMLPDILDKSVGLFLFHSARWIGHSILFQLSFCLILLLIDKIIFNSKYKSMLFVLLVGSILHVIGDLPSIKSNIIFWPLFGPFSTRDSTDFLYNLKSPFIIFTEITGFLIAILVGYLEKWKKRYWLIYFGVVISYIVVLIIAYFVFIF